MHQIVENHPVVNGGPQIRGHRPQNHQQSITGRDGYLVRQALAYAIVTIGRRPARFQERSNMLDMAKLLEHLTPDPAIREALLAGARWHLTGKTQTVANPNAT
jgi:hypothetical protein